MPPTNGELGGIAGGMTVNQQSALQISVVYSCVSLLSSSVATLPLRLMNNSIMTNAKELKPSPLLTEPYVEISLFDWIVQFVSSLALRGNFYGQIISRDKNLYPTQIKPIPADNAMIRRQNDGTLEYRFFNEIIPTRNVFHVRMLSFPGMLAGVNPIEAMRLPFSLALSQMAYGDAYFRNSANPQGVIQVPGNLPPDETKKMLRSWLSAHQGINKANLPAVLTDGAEFKPITITPEDSQFLESRNFSASEIAGIFRIPPHMISQVERSTSWGRGIEEQEAGFTRNTLGDYIGRLQSSLTALHPPGQYVNLDLTQRLRGNSLERAQTASLLMLAGVVTADEVRARFFDMPKMPDGQGEKPFVPINTELLEAALEQIKQQEKENKEPQHQEQPEQFPQNGNGDPKNVPAPVK